MTRILLSVLLASLTLGAQAANVLFSFGNPTNSLPYLSEVVLTTTNFPTVINGVIVVNDSLKLKADTNGQCIFSNLYPATYNVMFTLAGKNIKTPFQITLTNSLSDPSTVAAILTAPTNSSATGTTAFSMAESVARFYPLTSNPSNYISSNSPTIFRPSITGPIVTGTNYFTNNSAGVDLGIIYQDSASILHIGSVDAQVGISGADITADSITASTLSGNGGGLINLQAGSIAAGTVPTARMGSGSATSSTFLRGDNTWATPTSSGVTSVGLSLPGVIFNASVTGSPVTTSGTLTPTLLVQTSNTFLAGPASGSAATPTFRAMVTADVPGGILNSNQFDAPTRNQLALAGTGTDATKIPTNNGTSFNLTNISTLTTSTVKAPDGSGSNQPGTDSVRQGGASTGTGRGGALIEQTTVSGSTGSSVNGFNTRMYRSAKLVTVTDATASTLFNIPLASGKQAGGRVFITAFATDGTDFQTMTYLSYFSANSKAGSPTAAVTANASSGSSATTGTITASASTMVASGATLDFKVNVDSSFASPTIAVMWQLELNSNDTGAITAQ